VSNAGGSPAWSSGTVRASLPGMATATARNSFFQRLLGAAALDVAIYEDVEADRASTGQAMAVVLLSSLAAGVGNGGLEGVTLDRIVVFTSVALLSWAAWALVTFEVGARLLPGPDTRADVGELLRTLGFASTPGLIRVFGIMPGMALPAAVIAAVWMLAAMVVAVRQALDYRSTARAISVCLLGWALVMAATVVIGVLFGPTAS
jgi:hypothetical protein